MAKYEYWKTEEGQTLLKGWARDGLTDEQIAENMGVVRSTLSRWKNEHKDISDALKNGKEIADFNVENALYIKALGGDTLAMIFWLKNRKPHRWRDKPEEKHGGEVVQIVDDIPKG